MKLATNKRNNSGYKQQILSWPSAASFTNADPADFVFGQNNFYTNINVSKDQESASTLDIPAGMTVDANNNLYVADELNHRVLVFLDPIATDTVADFVFGQPDFTTTTQNTGGISANSLFQPIDVAVDANGTLYVADHNNYRVLIYFNPLTSDRKADVVIGQPNFTTGTQGFPTSATNLGTPRGIDVDSQGRLYVADYSYNRILVYEAPLTNGAAADFVLGQPNFTSNADNNGGLCAYSLRGPRSVTVDNNANVYVSDYLNHRVLIYQKPVIQNDSKADYVLGQPNFTSNQANQGGDPSANTLYYPTGLAVSFNGHLFVVDDINHRILNYEFPLLPGFSIYLPVTIN